jgi:hypothetical protein
MLYPAVPGENFVAALKIACVFPGIVNVDPGNEIAAQFIPPFKKASSLAGNNFVLFSPSFSVRLLVPFKKFIVAMAGKNVKIFLHPKSTICFSKNSEKEDAGRGFLARRRVKMIATENTQVTEHSLLTLLISLTYLCSRRKKFRIKIEKMAEFSCSRIYIFHTFLAQF